jgi:hypothetical protein
MKRHVAVYLESDELARFQREADRRRISLSRYLKERLTEPPSGDEQIEPTMLTQSSPAANEKLVEKTVRAAVARELKPIVEHLNLLAAMLDRFALSMLIHTPEIPEAQKKQAIASGKRRHLGWRTEVEEMLKETGLVEDSSADEDRSGAGNGAHA